MTTTASLDWPEGRRWQRHCLLAGAAGLGLCALGAIFDSDQFFHSYLLAYMPWLGIALGSLPIWLLHNLTGGTWGFVIRRLLEAATRTLPLVALLFLPIVFGLTAIYPWARKGDFGHNAEYLNAQFFLVRAVCYFAIWLTASLLFNRWSAAHDRTADPVWTTRAEHWSGPVLVLYGVTVTFAAIDWIMSLEPDWYSTIFGVLVATGQMLPALALAIAVAAWLSDRAPLAQIATPAVWNDLGSLLLAFVMLWTYMSFGQLLLIWSGNLPEEITWYLHRTQGGWQAIAVVLAVFYFAFPFLLLLSRDLKRHPGWLRWVALLLVVLSFVNQYWQIAPAFSPGHLYLHWMDLAALVGIGGLWSSFYLREVQARPLVPRQEPVAEEVLAHA